MSIRSQALQPLSAASQNERMRWYLFWIFVCLFVGVSLLTMLALFFGIGAVNERHEGKLVTAFIVEVGSAVAALFYKLFGLKQLTTSHVATSTPDDTNQAVVQEVSQTHLAVAPDISGKWNFVCSTVGKPFPDGGHEHGGIADIQLRETGFLTVVKISGTTQWKRDERGITTPINVPPQWHTLKGFFTGSDSFGYQYETTETKERQIGYSTLEVFYEEGTPVRLEGQFYNLPPGPQIYGTVKYTKEATNN
jgi:hypothetical protein